MKTGELAKMMGLNPKTITNWTDQEDLSRFFTPEAKSEGDGTGSQRDYSMDDVLVINTIRVHKTRQNTWRDVAVLLDTGHRETDLPLSANLTKTISPADQIAQVMVIKAERDTALAQLQDSLFEIDRLRKEIKDERENANAEIIKLNREIARLEIQLEMIQARLKNNE
jgi:DNA-binding transcriptional MerR regulator